MLTKYIEAAMKKAHYELIEDGTFWGNIPGFQGLWGNAPTLEACREDLKGALEVWLVLGLWLNDTELPTLGRLSIVPRKLASKKAHTTADAPRNRKAS
jgi:predicted RNase H-like HicB family nuclease